MDMTCMGVIRILIHLKEELAWTTDKQLRVISNITKELKNKAILNLKQYCICCYMILSNYCEIACMLCLELFNTLSLPL